MIHPPHLQIISKSRIAIEGFECELKVMTMNCAKSLKLLSDYHDGSLNVIEAARVRMHLMICPSCRRIFHDLELIIAAAAELRDKSPGACPDGSAGWRRFESAALKSAGSMGNRRWLRR
jgi:predicted anti-sigma-YlaC factor YlaD